VLEKPVRFSRAQRNRSTLVYKVSVRGGSLSSFTPRASIETRSRPRLLAASRHGFTFYVADPVSSIHEQ
jgi:hypothetical protein